MSELANCVQCNTLFVKTTSPICPNCRKKDDQDFDTVRKFIRRQANRKASLTDIVEATGVSEKSIIRYIQTGRLTLVGFPNIAYGCDKCGTPIQSGNICKSCQEEFKSELKKYEKEEAFKESVRQNTYLSHKKV